MKRLFAATSLAMALSGCYVAPVQVALPQAPLVAVPGPDRTEAQFRGDDAACRAALPPPPQQGAPQQIAQQQNATQQNATLQNATQPAEPDMPGVAYLRCMSAKGEVIEPLAPQTDPAAYGYYPAYPVYAGYDYGFPVFFGGFGFYGRGYFGGGFYHDGFYRGGFYRGGYGGGRFGGGGFGRR